MERRAGLSVHVCPARPKIFRQWPPNQVLTAHFQCFYFLNLIYIIYSHSLCLFLFPEIRAMDRDYFISPGRVVECEPLLLRRSSTSRFPPIKNSGTSWNPDTFFNGSPPIRATHNGQMGSWEAKSDVPVFRAFRNFDFIKDKPPVLSGKRSASSIIAQVSTCSSFFKNIYAILQICVS